MPSFSKAIAFLTAFAATSSITTTTVDAACECVGHQAGTAKIFADEGFPSDFGDYCRVWEESFPPGHPCAVGGADYEAEAGWCTEPWCYVATDNTCDDALDTVTFAGSTTLNTLQFSNGGACGIDTCGQCLPIMEGDEAVISVRLYKTSSAEEYLAFADEIATPFFSSQPGFISYTGVQTQDPEIVMFMSIYDTVENSATAWDKSKGIDSQFPAERLMNYYGTITWTGDDPGGDEDCVKSFDVGDYLSARMHYGDDRQHGIALTGGSYKIFSAVESFDSYTSSKGLGEYDTDSFFFETFNDKDDSAAANALLVSGTALDPSISLIYNVVGQVVFDSSCSDDYPVAGDDESSKCETVSDIIRSNPHLSHFEDLYEAATNAKGYYVSADTWTVFAPTDEAIESSGLAIDDVTAYSAIRLLLFHEVKGQALTASDLNCDAGDNLIEMGSGQATRTICNKDVPIGQKGGGNGSPALFVGDEIVACNGVVQIIDKVLLPPSTVSWYSGLGLN